MYLCGSHYGDVMNCIWFKDKSLYEWIGPPEERPFRMCGYPGLEAVAHLVTEPCTCGPYRELLDTLEAAYTAMDVFKMRMRTVGTGLAFNHEDIDDITSTINRFEYKLMKQLGERAKKVYEDKQAKRKALESKSGEQEEETTTKKQKTDE